MIKRFYILLLAIVASVGMSWGATTDLASISDDYTVQDGEILTGTLGVNVKISIADGATVTLLNANINGDKTWTTGDYAGFTCLGDATITIVGKNSVSGFSTENGYPGIYVPSGKTLIINGTGSLTAQSSTEEAAGIGAGRNTHCGNIEIQSGKITAIAGGEEGAGIGGAFNADCGNITISGGIVTAIGGYRGVGIGGGRRSGSTDAGHCGNILISGGVVSATSGEQAAAIGGGRGNNNNYKTNCGTITITNTALKVYAHQGGGSTNTIGAGKYGTCGEVTIGGNTGVINADPYTYRTKEDGEIVVDYINAIGSVAYTQECKDKIDIARELYDALEDSQKTLVTNYQTLLDAEAAYAALIPAEPVNQLYMEVDGTAGTLKWGLAGSNPVYDGDAIQYSDRKYITTLTIDESCQNHTLTSFYNLFHIFKALTTINGIENLATANVESMRYMFYDCQSLTSLDLSSFNTANVTDMKGMFNGCSNLTTIYVGADWNTSAVTEGSAMFYGCTNLPNYDSDATGVAKAYVGAGGYLSAKLTPADVMALINAIGEVEYTAESKAKIDAAREAYDALNTEDQALVTNYSTLQQAETDYANAKQAADQAAAAPVIAKINEIPSPMTAENTKLSVYPKVQDARAAYDALTADQKALVSNYSRLTDAEDAFAAIGGGGLPTGALTGAFSVGESSAICFSQGNLQATTADLGANWTWSFAANQWDFIGNAVANTAISDIKSVSTNGTVDLFGWSTAATYYGISNNPGGAYYTGDFIDWGTNAISNGGNTANAWHTLAHDEWDYLFNTRTTTSGIRYAKATVNGIPGIILLPDDWSATYYALSNTNDYEVDFNSNVIATSDWTNLLEANGAVFLPAAGERLGADVNEVGSKGHYWSSTFKTDYNAYCLSFNSYNLDASDYINRREGYSVRLVVVAPVNYIAEAQAAVDLINAIPDPVTLDEACLKAVNDAREAYNKLSEAVKGLLEEATIAKLTTAEAAFENVMNIWLSGDCDVILWKDTTLTVRKHAGEGNGAMADYNYMSRAPWYSAHWYDPQPNDIVIKSVTIEEGVTYFGDYAFAWMDGLKTVTIPASVTSIHQDAFYWSKAIDDIYLTADTANLTWGAKGDSSFKPEKATRCHVPSDLLEAYQTKFPEINVTFVGDLAPVDPAAGAAAIVDLINAIGTVEYTDECKAKIDAAREAYDKAVDAVKDLISADDLKKLTDAETEYADLKAAADQAEADKVIAKINNIPQPVELKLATRDSIESARAAYNALTDDQKLLVSNYDVLEAAEATLAGLNPGGGAAPAGALNGAFTINADGSKIAFSKGNLQYQASTATLRFATNQYDMIGEDNANISDTYTGWIDLFGWGTGNNPAKKSTVDEDYSTFTDWGVNAISNGGNEANLWRTLTRYEWAYLIQTRTNAADLKGQATVADVHGFVLLPDSWTLPAGLSFTASPNDWTTNVYTAEQWAQMEAAGAVFLPAAGYRNPDIIYVGEKGWYWSSDVLTANAAYDFEFTETNSRVFGSRHYFGQPVRLVAEGGGPAPLDSAQVVKDLIDAIPVPVTLDDACVNAVQAARDAYNALSDAAKGALDDATVQKLNQAIADYTALIQAGADAVTAKINNIPQPVELKLATRDSIESARAAYDALTAEQQALVSNYDVLEAAEATWATLNPGGGMPAGALSGKFTINESGDQIMFSKGNLQATTEDLGETWTWGFAANQWDFIGNAAANNAVNGNRTVSANGTVDLFGWSTPTTYYGIHNSKNNDYYSSEFREWGENITGAEWKTLSPSDWIYIISNRADAAQKQGQATVNGVNGYIFLPDEWELPTGLSFTAKPNNWTANVYEGDDWTAMENAGAVFLPKSPWRAGNTVSDLTAAYYWSSDYNNSYMAMAYSFQEDASIKGTGINRYAGIPVRLVTAGGASPTPLDSAQAVKDLIEAIPSPVTLDSNDAIDAAREAYDALSEAGKGALDDATVAKLTQAEADYAALIKAASDTKALIEAIPQPVVYTEACKAAIDSARVAYDALSDELKPLVTNYSTLTDAEAAYQTLQDGVEMAIAKIDAIPATIEYNADCKDAILDARAAYDALSDEQKAAFPADELQKLTDAEAAYAAIAAEIEHNVQFIAGQTVLAEETIALTKLPNGAPEVNGFAFDHWEILPTPMAAGLHIQAIYRDLITVHPVAFDTLMYNGIAQNLITAGVPEVGHLEYRIGEEAWSVNLPQATNAGVYAIQYKLVREGKEDYIAPDTLMATIAKAPVTYIAPVAYDTLVYTAANQTLIIAGQTNDGTMQYTLTPNDANSWKTALPQGFGAGTYNVSFRVVADANHLDSIAPAPVVVTITKAALTATADDKTVIYGDAIPTYTVTYAGWQGEDTISALTGTIAYTCAYAPTSNVGEYTITPSGVDAANYTITFVNGKVTVNQAALTITAVNDTVTYGDAIPTYTATYSGFKNGDTINVVSNLQYFSDYAPTSNVGEYTIHPDSAKALNYTMVFVNGKVTVNQAALTITADNKSVEYGEIAPEFTASYEGWKNNDTTDVVTGLEFACDYLVTSNVGEYTIHPDSAKAMNYAITFVDGKLTVNQAPMMITADDKNVIYGDAVPTYTASYSGWKNDDSTKVDELVTGLTFACAYAVTSSVGEYTITPDSAMAMNYAISYTNGKVTVNQAALTITANDTAMIYGDEAPAFTASYEGWLNSDDASVVSGLAYTCVYAPGSPIGTYAIEPNSATAENYAITFVNGTLTVNKAVVTVSEAEAQIAKFADGHTGAVVLNNGKLNGIKLNDAVSHITTAAFSSAEVSEHLTITLFYELSGEATLLNNYDLQPTSEIFSTEGVIIEPFIPDTTRTEEQDEDQTEVQEGISVYAYGYCEGDNVGLKYHLNSGNPDQYKIEFEDSRFTNVDWSDLDIAGKDGLIYIDIPVDVPTGDYQMTVYFRDSRFDWLESQKLNVTFHVNLPETYVKPLFGNTIVLIDTCECFTDIQWYYRENSSDPWQPIPGATGHYYHAEGNLTGEYFVSAKMNGVPTYTCGQTDMETLYGGSKQAKVSAYPNPVVNTTTVTIEASDNYKHDLRIITFTGVEVDSDRFEGEKTVVDMSDYPQGSYMISVDGIVVKVMKK